MDLQDDIPAASAALRAMLTRYSISPKYLGEPGPTAEQLDCMALAALRAPDHGKLVPFRFVVSRGAGLAALEEIFVAYGRRRGKDEGQLEAERQRARQAPCVIAVIARIHRAPGGMPEHEQWIAVGGAVANALMALHLMGFGAKMLSGSRAADPEIAQAYCRPGEQLVGWISVGTPTAPARPRGDQDPATVLSELQARN